MTSNVIDIRSSQSCFRTFACTKPVLPWEQKGEALDLPAPWTYLYTNTKGQKLYYYNTGQNFSDYFFNIRLKTTSDEDMVLNIRELAKIFNKAFGYFFILDNRGNIIFNGANRDDIITVPHGTELAIRVEAVI